ncbi:hypothetical protein ABK040_013633 [Willaertia magna]
MIFSKLSNKCNFSSLFGSASFSDFHFEFSNENQTSSILKAHKIILNQNEFFKSLFQTNTLEVNENKMKIRDDPNLFSLLIKSLYDCDLDLKFNSMDEFLPFILLADKYQFINVRDSCCNLLTNLISKENCALIWLFSNEKDYLSSINKKSAQILRDNYFSGKIDKSKNEINDMVSNFNVEEMILFLETFITFDTNTDVVLSIIVKWTESDQQTRASHVFNILQIIEKKKNNEQGYQNKNNTVNPLWLENNSTKLIKTNNTVWKCFFGNLHFDAHQNTQFSLKIDNFIPADNTWGVVIGIATQLHSNNDWLGNDSNGYGFIGLTGKKNHNSCAGSCYSSKTLMMLLLFIYLEMEV